ncbi:hypothetical protein AGR6A_Cc100030 [Agrobacterium sp. NCPPB 925]|nr:hypothetical protein AGR6A_Cc100030 [Agrobacterium sp. NCPPB 925]
MLVSAFLAAAVGGVLRLKRVGAD